MSTPTMPLKEAMELDNYLNKHLPRDKRRRAGMHVFDDQVRQLLRRVLPKRGVCTYCRCTAKRACLLTRDGHTCAWANSEQNVCTNPRCLDLYKRDLA